MWNWRKISNLQVFKKLILMKGASLVSTQSDGSESTVSASEMATLDGLTSTTAELNILDGVTATAVEINNGLDASTRVVSITSAGAVTAAANGNGKINTLDLLAGFDTTLPAATGTGDSFHFRIGTVNTSADYGILAAGTDTLTGVIMIVDTDSTDNVVGFAADGTDDKAEINGTTKGGLTIGDWIEFTDTAAALWMVRGQLTGSGTIITPFAAT